MKERGDCKARFRAAVLLAYGSSCACCGESQLEFLGIDHIDGRGKVGQRRSGAEFYRWLKRQGFPKDDYRLLCHNCNQALGHYGYCPHGHAKRGVA